MEKLRIDQNILKDIKEIERYSELTVRMPQSQKEFEERFKLQ